MPVYFIAHISVRDPETFAKYAEAAQTISAQLARSPSRLLEYQECRITK